MDSTNFPSLREFLYIRTYVRIVSMKVSDVHIKSEPIAVHNYEQIIAIYVQVPRALELTWALSNSIF